MIVAVLSILVALFLGFGAVQELVVRGVRGGEAQPFVVGSVGVIVSLLLAVAGVAYWRRGARARRLLLLASLASVAFHAYAALPPHRNVGAPALLVGVGYGLALLAVALNVKGGEARAA